MAKYGPKAQRNVGKELHEHKHKGKYKSREQAIAVGLSKTGVRAAKRQRPKTPAN